MEGAVSGLRTFPGKTRTITRQRTPHKSPKRANALFLSGDLVGHLFRRTASRKSEANISKTNVVACKWMPPSVGKLGQKNRLHGSLKQLTRNSQADS